MKEKLIEDLKNQDLNEFERKYIVAVVEYIDSNMQKFESEDVNFENAINRMLELAHSINNCYTGVSYIDNITNLRKQMAYSELGQKSAGYIETKDFRTGNETYGFVRNFIATISNYGGLYKYVCETYSIELDKEELSSMSQSK